MNIQNVSQREILDFSQFLKKVHDYNYKPLAPSNQSENGLSKSGLSPIKREPAYDHVGYADSVFAKNSRINVPGLRISGDSEVGGIGMLDASGSGSGIASMMQTSESLSVPFSLKKLSDF